MRNASFSQDYIPFVFHPCILYTNLTKAGMAFAAGRISMVFSLSWTMRQGSSLIKNSLAGLIPAKETGETAIFASRVAWRCAVHPLPLLLYQPDPQSGTPFHYPDDDDDDPLLQQDPAGQSMSKKA